MNRLIGLKTITLPLLIAVSFACFGLSPTAKALLPAPSPDGGYPGGNTAEGINALHNVNTALGINNTAVGANALTHNTTGAYNVAVGAGALASNTTGNFNLAIGTGAFMDNNASYNLAVGFRVGFMNTTGNHLTGIGAGALLHNTTGSSNTAIGADALNNNSIGHENTANGTAALEFNDTGSFNTAIGSGALTNLNGGDRNTAIGRGAGANYTGAESNNICIGDQTGGETGESNTIRIGSNMPSGGLIVGGVDPFASDTIRIGSNMPSGGMIVGSVGALKSITIGAGFTGGGIQYQEFMGQAVMIAPNFSTVNGVSHCFVGGIFNQTPAGGSHGVVVGLNGQLGDVTISSRRFKKDIAPIDKISEGILALKPVTFHFKNDDTNYPQFGLIAEEVAEVNPDWITRDPQGEIYGVRYDTIPILLLNEFLKEHRKNEEQQVTIALLKSTDAKQEAMITQLKSTDAKQEAIIAKQQKQIEALTAGLQKVSAQLELSKPAPQTVKNTD